MPLWRIAVFPSGGGSNDVHVWRGDDIEEGLPRSSGCQNHCRERQAVPRLFRPQPTGRNIYPVYTQRMLLDNNCIDDHNDTFTCRFVRSPCTQMLLFLLLPSENQQHRRQLRSFKNSQKNKWNPEKWKPQSARVHMNEHNSSDIAWSVFTVHGIRNFPGRNMPVISRYPQTVAQPFRTPRTLNSLPTRCTRSESIVHNAIMVFQYQNHSNVQAGYQTRRFYSEMHNH